MSTSNRLRLASLALVVAAVGLSGCQQKMATQPAPRPYEESEVFVNKQSVRPLEKGVIHRNQPVADDPLVAWLTPAGKSPKVSKEWKDAVDPNGTTAPTAGAPTDVANYVNEFPFEMAMGDLSRGQSLYNAACALCHGGAGYGNGKIPERGFLKPPSYHLDPNGEEHDAGHFVGEGRKELPVGHSRGFDRYGKRVALKDAPLGYLYQVITWGYGGMGSHETQIPNPADRWRIIAYVRALQLSQSIPVADLPAKTRDELTKPGPTS